MPSSGSNDIYSRPLKETTLRIMAGHIGSAAYYMTAGELRWVREGDHLAGHASMLAARALIEFLVGRPSSRPRSKRDIWPCDYQPKWKVDDDETALVMKWLELLDRRLAHLSLHRVEERPDPPEGWHETVARLLRLVRRFAEEIREKPAYKDLVLPLANAEHLMREEDERRERR